MKNQKRYFQLLFLFGFFLFIGNAVAQTPTDQIMMKQKEICFGLFYEHSTFDEYWEGTLLRTNATIATVNRKMGLPMVAVGIFNRLNFLVSVPFVKTESTDPNGGKFAGTSGFQDLSIALKGEILKKELGSGNLVLLGTLGFSTPVTNYLSDYRPYSLGNGTQEVSLRGILHYELENGFFLRGSMAYLWRGQTEAERDYYYNNGSYYTSWMDVPSAWNYQAVAGMWFMDKALRVEANFTGMKSTSGDDIRAYNAPQPTNKVNFDQVGLFAQYFFSKPKGFGVVAYFSQTVAGRNIGKAATIGGGLTYQFQL